MVGPVRAAWISRKTGFTRQHTYDLLKSLEQKGFLSKLGQNYGQRFIMQEPKNIKNIIEKKKSKLNSLGKKLEMLLPEMISMIAEKEVPAKIKFFEEIEGIRDLFEEMLGCRSKKHYYIGSIKEMALSVGEEYFESVVERRIKNGICSKSIRTRIEKVSDPFSDYNELREIRYVTENIKYLQTIVLYDNKVAVVSSIRENFGFQVESEEFSNTMRILFDALWEKSKK